MADVNTSALATLRNPQPDYKNQTLKVPQEKGYSGFVLLQLKTDTEGKAYRQVVLYVAPSVENFETKLLDLVVVDVPQGFSINNGDALAAALQRGNIKDGGDGPPVVRGYP